MNSSNENGYYAISDIQSAHTTLIKNLNFAHDAGYLDVDGCVTILGKNFYRVAGRDSNALGYDKNYVMQHYH